MADELFGISESALDLLDELGIFEDEEETILGYPSLQALTHVQKSPTKIKRENPWGFFLPKDAADMINFQCDDKFWKPITFYSSADTAFNDATFDMKNVEGEQDIQTHEGFISQRFSFHVVAQSATEIYEIISQPGKMNRYKFVDIKWRKGGMTPAADLLRDRDADNRPTHRWVKRYLLKLVDFDGTPLHEGLIQYRAHGGAGGSFGYEVNQYFNALTTAYSKTRGKRVQPGAKFKATCRISLAVDLCKADQSTIAYLDPSVTVKPIEDKEFSRLSENQRTEMIQRDKKQPLKVLKRPLSSVMVSANSEFGKELLLASQEHADYSQPPNQNSESNVNGSASAVKEISAKGHIAQEMTQLHQDGSATMALDTGEDFIAFKASAEQANALLDTHAEIEIKVADEVLINYTVSATDTAPAVGATLANMKDEDF